jgi:hypothetical protein
VLYVLVPSPFTGPLVWRRVAGVLDAQGVSAVVADLRVEPPEGESYWRAHVDAVEAAVGRARADDDVVLVVHSGAGPLVPAMCDRPRGAITAAVFIDAALPHPGQSRFDVLPPALADHLRGLVHDGRLPRWGDWFGPGAMEHLVPNAALRTQFVAELPEVLVTVMDEPMPRIDPPPVPTAYLRLSESYDDEFEQAREADWSVRVLDSTHLGMLTEPEVVAHSLRDLSAEALRR